ncbi:MAG: 50S ribosomal protein L29 [Spirochaetes bacterium GWB1_48_6]|nr:MAG: 50S ribosomal protein L29 [Spirochaetes bacterium GWB1_48_6]
MKDKITEITRDEAKVKLDELKKTYMDLRFQLVLGHVENPLKKRIVRRQIAQLNTILREFELGIRKA